MMLLLIAGSLSLIAWAINTSVIDNLWVAVVCYAATFVSCTFTYIQEGQASAVMKSFRKMLPASAIVLREGKLVSIMACDLVVGDVILVTGGDQIPADARVLYQQEMKVEKSTLTGESLPVSIGLHADKTDKFEEAANLIFNTTKCTEGECVAVVFATGDNTLIGRIAHLASSTKSEATPTEKEVWHFVIRLGLFSGILGLIFMTISFVRGSTWNVALVDGFILIIIACVPEGLPLTVVSCLTITAKRMAEKQVFVKQLRSVETLGSATVIASDKTGTITMNKMVVSRVWFDFNTVTAEAVLSDFVRLPPRYSFNSAMNRMILSSSMNFSCTLNALEIVGACCSRARFENETLWGAEDVMAFNKTTMISEEALVAALGKDSMRQVIGDASDSAIFRFISKRQSIELLRYHHRVVFNLPFNSRNKFAITIVAPYDKVQAVTVLKDNSMDIRVTEFPDVYCTSLGNAHTTNTSTTYTVNAAAQITTSNTVQMSSTTAAPCCLPVQMQGRHDAHSLCEKEEGIRTRTISLTSRDYTVDPEGIERSYNNRLLLLKGAPEVVIAKCKYFMLRGQRFVLDRDFMDEFQAIYINFGSKVWSFSLPKTLQGWRKGS